MENIIQLPREPFKNLIKYIFCWFKLKKHEYDLVINGDQKSSSGRLSTQFAKAKYKMFGESIDVIKEKYEDYDHISKYPIYNLRHYLSRIVITSYSIHYTKLYDFASAVIPTFKSWSYSRSTVATK